MRKLSIILPVYKAEKVIEDSVNKIERYLKNKNIKFELIIVDDGEEDNTALIAKKLSSKKNIKRIHNQKRVGRGKALKDAFSITTGDIIIYMDIDLATDIKHIKELINSIKEGYDISTGSRLIKYSKVKNRKLIRTICSKTYNLLVRILLKSKIRDHQCGFKAFNKKTTKDLIKLIKNDRWFFDTELLIKAQRIGLNIFEFPVNWEDKHNTTVRLIKDIKEMGNSIVKLKGELNERD